MTPKEARELWCQALESGEYQQGEGVLRSSDNQWCCLGVACDLAVNCGVIDGFEGIDADLDPYPEVMRWLDLRTGTGSYGRHAQDELVTDNDNGKSFTEIAAIIRSEPDGLLAA